MANYDEIKKMAKEAFDTLADASVEAYKLAEERARILAKKAKLTAGIANERATIRRLKVELGGAYYMLNKDTPAEELKQLCDEITAAIDRIDEKKQELEDLKNATCTCEEDVAECECEPEPKPEPEAEPETKDEEPEPEE